MTHNRAGSLARLQAFVTFGVVASFLVTTVVVSRHALAIGRDADVIVDNALPSVQFISEARSALHKLDATVDDWDDVAHRGGVPQIDLLEPQIAALEAALTRYRPLTTFPHEYGLYLQMRGTLATIETLARQVADAVRAGDMNGAEAALVEEQRSAVRGDDQLQQLIELNVGYSESLGRDIARVRRSTATIAFTLNGIAAALAALATALSIVAMSRGMKELQEARALAERKSAELDHFAGRVAHDILSPLATVQLSLDLIARTGPENRVPEHAMRRASRSVARVGKLVEGLLVYARAGARPDPKATAEVSDVIRDVLDGARKEADAHGVELALEGVERATVASSIGVLTSLVGNLVQNAIKYIGEQPEKVVTVRTRTQADRVRVEVQDTGPGVPAGIQDTVFEPFVRGGSQEQGIGLGLATVRQLAGAHGGDVGYRTMPGHGSVFWFELPRARAVQASPSIEMGAS
jgi:signal transduction histidine kinase